MESGVHNLPSGRINVLLAEDDPGVRQVLVMMLRAKGHQVREASNGRDAMEQFRRERPDIVISDMEMPVVDGEGLCRLMREEGGCEQMPVILITGRRMREAEQCAAEWACAEVLVKPFSPAVLEERMHRLVRAANRIDVP